MSKCAPFFTGTAWRVAGVIVDPSLRSSASPGYTFMLNLMSEQHYEDLVREYWEQEAFEVASELQFTPPLT